MGGCRGSGDRHTIICVLQTQFSSFLSFFYFDFVSKAVRHNSCFFGGVVDGVCEVNFSRVLWFLYL